MGLFIFFQVLFDLGVVAACVWIYLNKELILSNWVPKNETSASSGNWKQEWELEKQNQAQQLALQLRSIRLLYEQTKKLMDEKAGALAQFPVSQEETELKHLVSEKVQSPIPTLIEFEAQKDRLKKDSSLDLKSLLSDQLC